MREPLLLLGGDPPRHRERRRRPAHRGSRTGHAAPGRRRAARVRGCTRGLSAGRRRRRAADLCRSASSRRARSRRSRAAGNRTPVPRRMQRKPVVPGDVGESTDRLNGAHLVVGPHRGGEGDIAGVAVERLAQGVRVDPAVRVDGRYSTRAPSWSPSQLTASRTAWCSTALATTRVRAGSGAAGPVQPLDGEVVGLGAAGGKDDLAGPGAERLGDCLAGLLDGAPGGGRRRAGWRRCRCAQLRGQRRQPRQASAWSPRGRGMPWWAVIRPAPRAG